MAPPDSWSTRRGVQNLVSLPLLSLVLLLSSPKQVAALTNMEGTYIIGAIFFIFLVVDIFLIVFLVAWIRSEIARKDYHMKKEMIRHRSIECLESNVRLQIRRKPSSPDSESSNEETSFSEDNKVNSKVQDIEGDDTLHNNNDEVFIEKETGFSDKSFQERKREAQLIRPNTRTESETPLLLGDVNVEETLKPAQLLLSVEEMNSLPHGGEKPPQYQRLQSSDFRKDNKAPLLENEINIEGESPSSSPVKYQPIQEEEYEGDVKLVSLASRTTGPIIPADSPPHSIPSEIKSLDVSGISGTVQDDAQVTETSFITSDDQLHSTSGTSIEWNGVFKLINENAADVEDTVKLHVGQLAPESFLAMSSDNCNYSNTSLNSTNDNGSVNQSMTQPLPMCSNHERALSYDDNERVSKLDLSYPPYLTPQHVLPRPRGRSNPGQDSLSLTSPAHKRRL